MANTTIEQVGSVIEKTYLLRLHFGMPMGVSRKVPTSLLSSHAASKALRIMKDLLESKELDALKTADNKMRARMADMCLPYDMGLLLLPRVSIEQGIAELEAYADERKDLLEVFISAYPGQCDTAKSKFQELAIEFNVPFDVLYNAKDYPTVDTLRARGTFDWDILSLTVPEELKLSGKYEQATANLQAKIEYVSEEITTVMRETLLDLVAHLKDSLEPNADGKPKRLFATAVTNVQDFLATFKARNITNDSELDALVSEVQTVVHPNVNVDMLKKDESFKTSVHDSMASITEQLTKLVEVTPGRKFRSAVPASAPDTARVPEALPGINGEMPTADVTAMAIQGQSLYK
jgi:hypothetical protein